MADQQAQDPVFQIQRVYLKDLSLEQPNSPAILLEQEQPTVDIQLGVDAQPVAEGIFEITVSIQRGGFPPVHLAEINFQAMYEQQQAQAAGQPSPTLAQ
jgi:preprotein translocase subunit SecB